LTNSLVKFCRSQSSSSSTFESRGGQVRVFTKITANSPNSTWLVTSRLDTTQHVRRVETSVSSRAVPTWRTANKL